MRPLSTGYLFLTILIEKTVSTEKSAGPYRVDFGIITIREDEFRAALHYFDDRGDRELLFGRRDYNLRVVKTHTGRSYQIAIVRCVEPGTGEAQEVARDMIDDLNPQWIIVLGVAGGTPSDDYTLGDVIVSTRVHDFSVESVLSDGSREFSLGGGPVERRAGAIIANLPAREAHLGAWNSEANLGLVRPVVDFKNPRKYKTKDKEWKAKIRDSLQLGFETPRDPIATSGEIGSSDRLVKDPELLKLWQKAARKLMAIEMETAGVYRAARERVGAIAIRGISDIVGFARDDAMTKFACRTAAAFCSAFLKTEPLPPLGGNDVPGHTLSPATATTTHPLDWAFRLACRNIANYGDTDVFPFPPENLIFRDCEDLAVRELASMHDSFDERFRSAPPSHHSALTLIGYTSFRWASQLDPLWNAYLLGIVIAMGAEIEAARLPVSERSVFSYRFAPSETGLFRGDDGWLAFQMRSLELATEHPYALKCDIADFYQRVSHENLENALGACASDVQIPWRVRVILNDFTAGMPVGLPVGGPAARLLSELALNNIDHLLHDRETPFCRYCDDFHVFAQSESEMYEHLVFIGEHLQRDHGLTLQKLKTRLMRATEFRRSLEALVQDSGDGGSPMDAGAFLRVRLRFDPYSPTAVEDYEKLVAEVERFDILGMLSRELTKSRIHDALVRRLLGAIDFLSDDVRAATIATLLDGLQTLTPVMPTVLIVFRRVFNSLPEAVQDNIIDVLAKAVEDGAPALRFDANLGFALRVLGERESTRVQKIFTGLFDSSTSPLIRRDIILLEAKWGKRPLLSTLVKRYRDLTPWERRALVLASYELGSEGRAWRSARMGEFDAMQKLLVSWADKVSPRTTGYGLGNAQ